MAHNSGNFSICSSLLLQCHYTSCIRPLICLLQFGKQIIFCSRPKPASFLLFLGPMVCVREFSHMQMAVADYFIGWWLILFFPTCWRYFNHAGNLPLHADSWEVNFPTHQSYVPLNWDPLCCDSVFHKVENGRSRFRDISLLPCLPPSLGKKWLWSW